ncbi:hypothetical protein K7X08_036760 [Anisodus acutangulus]|uniref:Terpene synthase metal-binding domain-containing protein n=1 Tax=Anisodus acutangulus TaxID=402998 RepID=A0A9Q1L7S5_9SOLA|nr:hypothetical protein K7X08_036760 [Anisodus acutangulus]
MSHLKKYLHNNQQGEDNLTFSLVRHALELPLHCMMLRVETKWCTNVYERMPNADPQMLELAKLDYNIVQAIHQEDLRNLSRRAHALQKNFHSQGIELLKFLWIAGMMFEPQKNQHSRTMLTKVTAMATVIDDIYGTLDELEVFTDAIERMKYVSKSIQCYMNEKGVSEEEARNHINFLIKET